MNVIDQLAEKFGEPLIAPPPDAPGWRIAVLRTPDGLSVSGKGPDDAAARASCLGEAAELTLTRLPSEPGPVELVRPRDGAVRAGRAEDVFWNDLSNKADQGNEACAAAGDIETARKSALLELLERDAVTRWWRGMTMARRLPAEWIENSGLGTLARTVRGTPTKRTEPIFFVLDDAPPVVTIAALSRRLDGSLATIGFAAGLTVNRAALSALSEMFQMEASCALAQHRRQAGQPLAGDDTILARSENLERLLGHDGIKDWDGSLDLYGDMSLHEITHLLPDDLWFASFCHPDIPIHVARAFSDKRLRTRPLKFSSQGGPV